MDDCAKGEKHDKFLQRWTKHGRFLLMGKKHDKLLQRWTKLGRLLLMGKKYNSAKEDKEWKMLMWKSMIEMASNMDKT